MSNEKLLRVAPESLKPNPYQPRKEFSPESLKELTESIKENGILQAPTVTQKGEELFIIAGERRVRAAVELALPLISVVCRDIGDDTDLAVLGLLENVQREDLSPLEVSEGYAVLLDKYRLTQKEIAEKIGKSRSSIANTLRLTSCTDRTKKALKERKITEAHAMTILSLASLGEDAQDKLLQQILRRGLSVKQTQRVAGTYMGKAGEDEDGDDLDLINNPYTEKLREYTPMAKFIPSIHGGGRVVLSFKSDNELDEFMSKVVEE